MGRKSCAVWHGEEERHAVSKLRDVNSMKINVNNKKGSNFKVRFNRWKAITKKETDAAKNP